MKNTIGNVLTLTLFGESHGEMIGVVIDGLPSGFHIDRNNLEWEMEKRKAAGSISTARHEADKPMIVSGLLNDVTEGTPLTILIANQNTRSQDYEKTADLARPGHADYTAHVRYHGFQDVRGGGHFSGRLTAPLVAAGAIMKQMLLAKNIRVGTHISMLHGIKDTSFTQNDLEETLDQLNQEMFAVIDPLIGERMKQEIEEAREKKDSVGGILETAVTGLEAGIGEPEFDSLESRISHAVFSIPAVKGIEFGSGFAFADMYGSQANDSFAMVNDQIETLTNHNGGINGGISNGMPILFRTVIKPTPSIAQTQKTVDFIKKENSSITIQGRHDPAIIHRARVVVDAMTAFTLCDMLAEHHGTQWLGEKL